MSFLSFLETLLIGPLKLIFEMIYSIANIVIGHPGLSIVALSMMMNILVLPLYRRADAMQEEARDMDARLQEGVAHIKKTFSGDERMMLLQTYYRQNDYSPLSALNGSVSLLLEIPFFMAAYQFLSHVGALNGVSLGPIRDLGTPDSLLVIGGLTLNLLPILMTGINVISSAIYLKGFPLKTKVQLYGIAAVFLVFLYNSPSGLVFYWTLNNVFSLVKNIFYKLKNPRKVLAALCCLMGFGLIGLGLTMFAAYPKRRLLVYLLGITLQAPAIIMLIASRVSISFPKATPNRKLYFLACLFLTIQIGAYIPASYIAASPQEYVDPGLFMHPLWHMAYTITLGSGMFLIWMQVFYWLANNSGKAFMDKAAWVLCGVMLVDYMFFGTDLGTISSTLQYSVSMAHPLSDQIMNLVVIAITATVMWIIAVKCPKMAASLLLVAAIAMGSMSALHVNTVITSINDGSVARMAQEARPEFTLTKNGKNVVILFLDRAIGPYVPYMMKEDPNLAKQFDGFTYYSNTISFSSSTNAAAPALHGGYEYTPVELNKRADEPLVMKHNEALQVLPVIFDKNGYKVTVCDPTYAGYQWIPDLTIFDEYPNITAYITEGKFESDAQKRFIFENTHRNFFCFALMKSMPLVTQSALYNNGIYLQAAYTTEDDTYFMNQTLTGLTTARGLGMSFMRQYNVLKNLDTMANITDSSDNTFLILANNVTHEPTMLQVPEYIPKETVDNTNYYANVGDLYTIGDTTLRMDTPLQVVHYHANMAALKQLGKWFDMLRQQGIYDNTRIIVVSDHGYSTDQLKSLLLSTETETLDLTNFAPLLMVKDFNRTGFTTSDTFMTNADVPTLAVQDLISDPINPFTGNRISSDEKTAHPQIIYRIIGDAWDVNQNGGNTLLPTFWLSVQDNLWNLDNWSGYASHCVLNEHKLP